MNNNQRTPVVPPGPKPGEIEITNWKPHAMKTLRGFFTATLADGMILHSLSLHEKGDTKWINPPSRSYKDTQGLTHYVDLIEFANGQERRILAALDKFLAEVR
jgi:hypothetical protein